MLEDILRCPLCQNLLQVPKTLACGHTICSTHRTCSLHEVPVSADHIQLDVSLSKILYLFNKYSIADHTNEAEEDSDDEENDLLSHLRRESARERHVALDEPIIPLEDAFQKELIAELTCEICFSIFYDPTTTPCGHVGWIL